MRSVGYNPEKQKGKGTNMDSFARRDDFVQQLFARDGKRKRFFSLLYDGGRLCSDTLDCRPSVKKTEHWEEREIVYVIDPGKLILRMNMRIYRRFPIVECLPYLENPGAESSGIVEDIRTLDLQEELPPQNFVMPNWMDGTRITVRYNLGSCADINDFIPQKRELWTRSGSNRFIMESHEGRPSSTFLPYFGVDTGELGGMNIGVGWGGAWKAVIEIPLENSSVFSRLHHYRISLSMLRTRFRVLPGEKLRQVGFFLHFRGEKSVRDAQNEHRRFMIAHHAPRDSKGNLLKPPVSFVTWGGLSSEKMLERIAAIEKHQLPYEVFWVDAGWSGYPGPCPHFLDQEEQKRCGRSDWPVRVGNWEINSVPHPDGLKPVSGAARKAGMKFLAWFEPERVHSRCRGSILTEHPEWLKTCGDSDVFLLDLGNPDAREFIFQTLRRLIQEQGIDIYREDFNFNTLPFWAAMDAPDRIGVAEMKHVDGHYKLWEQLHQAFPDMPFDNCASGGRRLDYLALTYSWPLCQSDYACLLYYLREYIQVQNLYLSDWVPLHAGFTWMPEHDPYDFLSCSGTGVSNKIWQYDSRSVPADDAYDWEYHRTMLRHQKRLRDLQIDGNFHPLTERPDNLAVWCAYQIHVPESGCGCVLAFRRPQSLEVQMRFALSEIHPTAEYELEYFDGTTRTVRGSELAAGLPIVMETPRSVTLIYYREIK